MILLSNMVLPTIGDVCAAVGDMIFDASWLLLVLVIFLLLRFLRCFSDPATPKVTTNSQRMQEVMKRCQQLSHVYRPPRLWGRNGHLQTAFYGLLGHASLKRQHDRRAAVKLPDGTTVTFDVFEAYTVHPSGRDYTLCLCPGIANSSESNYIRTCVHYAQDRGYRCAVLNHLGALNNVLTSARLFSYGSTEELEAMLHEVCRQYENTSLICVGYSMGGNITTKLMASVDKQLRKRIVAALSVCQPYNALASIPLYHQWECGRRIYNYIITENVKRLLRRNYKAAVLPYVQSGIVDEERMWAATSIAGIDEYYNRRVKGCATVDEYYRQESSFFCIDDVQVPIVFLNAYDDPLVPPTLWMCVRDKVVNSKHDQAFILTKHGGHLGFLEGHSLWPSSRTWLDRFVAELADAFIDVYDSKK